MSDLYKCRGCGKPYRFDRLSECPSCGKSTPSTYNPLDAVVSIPLPRTASMDEPQLKKSRLSSIKSGRESDLGKSKLFGAEQIATDDLTQLIQAQNRTTHAVRSISAFLLLNILWMFVAGLFFLMALAIPQDVSCYYSDCQRSPSGFAIFLIVLAVLVSIAGFVFTLVASVAELRSSRVEKTPF